ncbi:ABC transporter substrate-binding protein [Maribellus maritimus]|uniref:ABC transporter substrate-binding protein n=1 Tax=Maribellus maritimus TaxID=2870838 RepID=UPI001EECCCBD|nr:ABC transporter substrate-binding protein [Maribellus maritimus]MCG6189046.1 ABC transporter substrate-binding protein [Maribellus maritimus]
MTKINLYRYVIITGLICLFNLLKLNAQEKITFIPQWLPQAQFAGYYAALDQGFYSEAGLELTIIHPLANISSFEYLKNGKADVVSAFLMDGIKQREKGTPLVNIAQLSQHSALMMVVKKESGINQIRDLHHKKLGIWSSGFDDIPLAFMNENNYEIKLIRILNTVNLFLMNGVDAQAVMYYNEYDQIINSGINEDELNTFFFADYGFDIPEDGLYCLEETLVNKREVLKKFISATFKGWDYVTRNKDYAIDLVVEEMNKAHLPNNTAHQRWMLDKILELMKPGKKNVKKGHLLEQDYYRALSVFGSIKPDYCKQILHLENFHQPLLNE